MTREFPTLSEAKAQAKALRAALAEQGSAIGHADALERIARLHGFRDWNTCRAAIADRVPDGWSTGRRVAGRYLSQPFQATVLSCRVERPGWVRLTLDLDEAVDAVTFDSFTNHRKRITAIVGPGGFTLERTSDGIPHLQLAMGG